MTLPLVPDRPATVSLIISGINSGHLSGFSVALLLVFIVTAEATPPMMMTSCPQQRMITVGMYTRWQKSYPIIV